VNRIGRTTHPRGLEDPPRGRRKIGTPADDTAGASS